MFRRPLRRMIVRPMAQNALALEMNHAEELLASGQPAQAAELYSKLANEAERLNHPRQAGNLHARAAHTWLTAGNQSLADEHAQKALSIFNRLGMSERASQFQSRFASHKQSPKSSEPMPGKTAGAVQQRGMLPATCPQCGAPLRSDEVDWVDSNSAECGFCGAVIHAS